MSKSRIGKLERWIIFNAYLKEENELPENWQEHPSHLAKRKPNGHEIIGLRKDEVMLNYFHLEPISHFEELYPGKEGRTKEPFENFFRTNPKSRSAYVSYSRTVKNLIRKGYVESDQSEDDFIWLSRFDGIVLTPLGSLEAIKPKMEAIRKYEKRILRLEQAKLKILSKKQEYITKLNKKKERLRRKEERKQKQNAKFIKKHQEKLLTISETGL